MWFFFGDDSRQSTPTRSHMGPLVAAGGILVKEDSIRQLETSLNNLCEQVGFPSNEEFKWSPGRELWMRDNLKGKDRVDFFAKVMFLARESKAVGIVIIEDKNCATATNAKTPEDDVSQLLLERVHNEIPVTSACIVIVDRPPGGRTDEDRFLSRSLENLQAGTDYVKHDRIVLNVLSTPSKLLRLLQLADLITSCTTAMVSGETQHAPFLFEHIKPLLARETGRIGGIGLKIHPDFKYANLYYWLLGDTHLWKSNCGVPFPIGSRPFSKDADTY